ncbi:unnamed protein product [Blepharisma stoltei]|uniref:Uncharacterized protein n=1 Tax=Blepharisma stoltei TaxID=1481888 RepID=A0AAU9KCB7_9CILI|nr:unnamed protein product [Blepharisma stoltei]
MEEWDYVRIAIAIAIIFSFISAYLSALHVKLLRDVFSYHLFESAFTYPKLCKIPKKWTLFKNLFPPIGIAFYKQIQVEIPRSSHFLFLSIELLILWNSNEIITDYCDFEKFNIAYAILIGFGCTSVMLILYFIYLPIFFKAFQRTSDLQYIEPSSSALTRNFSYDWFSIFLCLILTGITVWSIWLARSIKTADLQVVYLQFLIGIGISYLMRFICWLILSMFKMTCYQEIPHTVYSLTAKDIKRYRRRPVLKEDPLRLLDISQDQTYFDDLDNSKVPLNSCQTPVRSISMDTSNMSIDQSFQIEFQDFSIVCEDEDPVNLITLEAIPPDSNREDKVENPANTLVSLFEVAEEIVVPSVEIIEPHISPENLNENKENTNLEKIEETEEETKKTEEEIKTTDEEIKRTEEEIKKTEEETHNEEEKEVEEEPPEKVNKFAYGTGSAEDYGGMKYQSKIFSDEQEVVIDHDPGRIPTTADTSYQFNFDDTRRAADKCNRFDNLQPILQEKYKKLSKEVIEKRKALASICLIFGDLVSEKDSETDEFPHFETPRVTEDATFKFTNQKWNFQPPVAPSSPQRPEIDYLHFGGPPNYKQKSPLDDPSSPLHPDLGNPNFGGPPNYRQNASAENPSSPYHGEAGDMHFAGPPSYKQSMPEDEELPAFIDDQRPSFSIATVPWRNPPALHDSESNKMMLPPLPNEPAHRKIKKKPVFEPRAHSHSPYEEKLVKMLSREKPLSRKRNASSVDLLRSHDKMKEAREAYGSSRPGSVISHISTVAGTVRSLARSESRPGLQSLPRNKSRAGIKLNSSKSTRNLR